MRSHLLQLTVIVTLVLPAASPGQSPLPPNVRIAFAAQSDSFAAAVREYERIWAAEGHRIVMAMEKQSGLGFISPAWADTAITANVREVASYSGYRDQPMTLRASYPHDTKRATLVHELGHRLQSGLFRANEEEHVPLFYWVYDVWVSLYGQEFADAQVAVEKRRGERYVNAWNEALSLTVDERAAKWKAIRDERMRR